MLSSETLSKTSGETYLSRLNNCFNKKIYQKIDLLALDLAYAWEHKKNIFLCGNGGSGANAIHIANDLLYGAGACGKEPKLPGLRVEALTANQGILTCLSNDVGYENIFSRELEALGKPEDILIGITTSGNSPNIIKGVDAAKKIGITTFILTGESGGKLKGLADCVHIPSNDTARIQECHILVGHIICGLVEKAMFKDY